MVDLAALADAIREGRIAGAAVDVYPTEPEKNSNGFTTGESLTSHPHITIGRLSLFTKKCQIDSPSRKLTANNLAQFRSWIMVQRLFIGKQ